MNVHTEATTPDDRPVPVDTLVSVRSLNKRFVKRRTWEELLRRPFAREFADALRGVSFDVHRGEFFGILGQNGAGKTTLFKILATLVLPDSGSAMISGQDVVSQADRVRRILTPVIAEERSLYWRLSAYENLLLFASLYGLRGTARESRSKEILEVVGLTETGNKIVGAFSSGMKQRLLIGRALLAQPKVLLLDEPTRSLDPVAARDFRQFLRRELVDKQGCTVLLATHNADEALHLCDRVSVLHRGRLLAVGAVDELIAAVGDNTYRITAQPALAPILEQLVDAGHIRSVSATESGAEGWVRYSVQFQEGAEVAAGILAQIVASGIPVSGFEREDLALADLLERIMKGAGDA